MRIALTGGGTGGHIFPLIAVAKELKSIALERGIYDFEIRYLGPGGADKFLNSVFEEEGIRFDYVMSGKLRRYFSLNIPLDFFRFFIGFFQAQWKLLLFMPDAIFSKGGYGSLPVVLVGWIFRIPIIIHESDSVPGLANRISAKLSKRIALSFPSSAKYFNNSKIAILGNPVRNDLVGGSKEEANKIFNLKGGKPLILISGGSQGARTINDLIMSSINDILLNYEIIFICGEKNYNDLFNESSALLNSQQKEYFHLFPFLKSELKHALIASDLVISRAGAGTIFETAFVGKPSILIPLQDSAYNHQVENAYEYGKFGAAIVMEQQNMTPHLLLSNIAHILGNEKIYQEMSQDALRFSAPEAARKIAEEVFYWGEL